MSMYADLLPSGFLVVPLPESMARRGDTGRPVYGLLRTAHGDVPYGGVDRRWYSDLDEHTHEPGLPEEIAALWKSLHYPHGFLGLGVCRRVEDARTLLAYCNRGGETHEVIAVRAPLLVNRLGILPIAGYTVGWLGFDVLAYGEWSLLHDGLFRKPDVFAAFAPSINAHGLLTTAKAASAFATAYIEAVRAGVIEPFAPPMTYDALAGEIGTAYTVEVGRVSLQD